MTAGPRDRRGRWRVAVTGMGMVTPAGSDPAGFWRRITDGLSTATMIDRFDTTGWPTRFACQADGFEPGRHLTPKQLRRTDLFARFALTAALDALTMAGDPDTDPAGRAVVCGTGGGGARTWFEQAVALHSGGPAAVDLMTWPKALPYAAAALIAQRAGRRGPCLTVSTACASGTTAIGEAARMIRDGGCDTVLAGGTEAPIMPLAMAGFSRMGSLSTRNDAPAQASRPFDLRRGGYVLGEGAAFLHLERWDLALGRDAPILAEVSGYAQTCDAFHLTAPRPDGSGAAACITRALADSGHHPEEIRQVNAHGTGTELNDPMESLALWEAFPAGPPPVTASKGVLGHLLGAAGAAEAVVAALSAGHGVVPPVANHEETDPRCPLDVVTKSPRPVGAGPVLSNSFGFGGHNACLIIGPGDVAPC